MQDMINKVALNNMDEKFEEALLEVANSIDKFAATINDNSSKQYDDFNNNLKKAFGANLQ